MAFILVNQYKRFNAALRAGLLEVLNDTISYNTYSAEEYNLVYRLKQVMDYFPELQPPAKKLLTAISISACEDFAEDYEAAAAQILEDEVEEEYKNRYLISLKDELLQYISRALISGAVIEKMTNNVNKYKVPRENNDELWNEV